LVVSRPLGDSHFFIAQSKKSTPGSAAESRTVI
jgi:hypothetical protein